MDPNARLKEMREAVDRYQNEKRQSQYDLIEHAHEFEPPEDWPFKPKGLFEHISRWWIIRHLRWLIHYTLTMHNVMISRKRGSGVPYMTKREREHFDLIWRGKL